MGLFDFFKKKTDSTLEATQKVGEGVGNVADQVKDAAATPGQTIQDVGGAVKDAAGSVADATDNLTDKIPSQLDDKAVNAVKDKFNPPSNP